MFLENLSPDGMNSGVKKVGFNVGPTIDPCTKGLWIWKEVFYADK
jgi:hypothetical protein